MEQSSEQLKSQSPVVEHVGKKVWEAVVAIPVDRAWVDAVHNVSDQMTAKRFTKVKEILTKNAENVGRIASMGSGAVDVVISVATGVGAIKFGREMLTSKKSIERAKDLHGALQGERHVADFMKDYRHNKNGVFLFGGLAGGALFLRPVSRLVYIGAKLGGTVAERVTGAINTIALRQEAKTHSSRV